MLEETILRQERGKDSFRVQGQKDPLGLGSSTWREKPGPRVLEEDDLVVGGGDD